MSNDQSNDYRAQDNFYLHVNKKWLNDPLNRIPGDYPRWGGPIKLHDAGLKNQINLVKNLSPDQANAQDPGTKISWIQAACAGRFNSWKDGTAKYDPISRELEILDAYLMPNKPIQDDRDLAARISEYFYYTQINDIQNVFDFDRGSDFTNANHIVLEFSTSGLSLPGREYYMDDNFEEKRELFNQHLHNVSQLINMNSTVKLDDNFVTDVVEFETELAKYKMTRAQSRYYDEYYTNTTLSDLYKNINDLASVSDKQENYSAQEHASILDANQIATAGVFFEKVYDLFDFRTILKNNKEKFFGSWAQTQAQAQDAMPGPGPAQEHIVAFDGDAIRRIILMILNVTRLAKYRSFLQYKVISAFRGFCTKELDEEFFDFYARKLAGQAEQKSEDMRTIQTINGYAGEMLGKVYVAHYFPEQYKTNIRAMIDSIIDAMRYSIKNNDWLTSSTKEKALLKLSLFNIKVGYPDVWKDYSEFDIKQGDTLYDIAKKAKKWSNRVEFFNKLNSMLDRREWGMTPQTVNAYFSPTQNEIVFPAAILQPPFYCKSLDDIDFDLTEEYKMINDLVTVNGNDSERTCNQHIPDFTDAVNFGGIGAVIAHEITHGYDDQGRKFDGHGNLQDWWTDHDAKLFKAKSDLMAEQARRYVFVDPENNKTYRLNPGLTMGENLADLGGISLSLRALTARLERANLSPDMVAVYQRVMFKSYANVWKENSKKDFKINCLTTDCHAPPDFRANLVKNITEFYKVFNVTDQDAMYIAPAKRVQMW
jgi:predicted metalloendopeptidase